MKVDNPASDAVIKKKTDELIDMINHFSESLPKNELSEIRTRLKSSVNGMPEKIEQSFNGSRKIDKIRSWIKLTIALKECRETLDLIAKLKYGNPQDIINKVENFNSLLVNSHALRYD